MHTHTHTHIHNSLCSDIYYVWERPLYMWSITFGFMHWRRFGGKCEGYSSLIKPLGVKALLLLLSVLLSHCEGVVYYFLTTIYEHTQVCVQVRQLPLVAKHGWVSWLVVWESGVPPAWAAAPYAVSVCPKPGIVANGDAKTPGVPWYSCK